MKSIHLISLTLLAAQLSVLPIFAQADAENETFVPANPPALKPITSHHTPAYQAAKMFQRGVNLGDYLEAGRASVTITPDDFVQMKREGFDHVRVPVGWYRFAGPAPDFTLSPEIFARVDFAVTNALANKMAVMINIHHFNDLDRDPVGATAEFLALWRQIAAHYQKFPRPLAFELDNEPHENATTALMNPIYVRAITEIRKTNPARTCFGRPNRTIFVEPGGWGSIGELKNLVLPPDRNVVVSVHCYEPFHFTHQGAGWTTADVRQTGIVFPGPPAQPLAPDAASKPWVRNWIEKYNTLPTDKNPSSARAFTGKLAYIRAWSDFYGRPVHLGEFGAYIKADAASRANFYAAFRQAAEQEHIGWCIWDWNANFRYWDEPNHCALPGMHAALFGKTK